MCTTSTIIALILTSPTGQVFASPYTSRYITEYQIPTPDSRPMAIGADSNGKIWFVETDSAKLARFDPKSMRFTEFKIPTEVQRRVEAWDLVVDSNGGVWFTDSTGHAIWRFDMIASSFDKYMIPTRVTSRGHALFPTPLRLALDQEGAVWFTQLHGNRIGKISRSSEILEFELPVQPSPELPFGAGPAGIAVDRGGMVWITEAFAARIAKFDPRTFSFTEYKPDVPIYSPMGIAIDLRGLVWIADHGSSTLILYDPESGFTRQYVTSTPSDFPTSLPYWVAIDPHGDIWFNEHQGNKIARLKLGKEVLVEYHVPTTPLGNVLSITIDNEGNAWFSELTANRIGMVNASHPIGIDMEVQTETVRLTPGGSARTSFRVARSDPSGSPLLLGISGSITPTGRMINASAEYDMIRVEPKLGNPALVTLSIRADMGLVERNYWLTASASDGILTYSSFFRLAVETDEVEPVGASSYPQLTVVMGLGIGMVVAVWFGARAIVWRGRL